MSHNFIFTDPILVDPRDFASPASPCQANKDVMKLTVILVFNLALSHHLKALNSNGNPSNRSLDLQKAFSIYKLSWKTQVQHGVKLSDIHAMAHINNLGQIAAARGNKVAAKHLFRHLLNHLAILQDPLLASAA
jgi:hypothetical protein